MVVDGSFAIRGLPADRPLRFAVRGPDGATFESEPMTLTTGEERVIPVIGENAGRVLVRVVEGSACAADGWRVSCIPRHPPGTRGENVLWSTQLATIATDGTVAFTRPAGRWAVIAVARDRSRSKELAIVDVESAGTVEVDARIR